LRKIVQEGIERLKGAITRRKEEGRKRIRKKGKRKKKRKKNKIK